MQRKYTQNTNLPMSPRIIYKTYKSKLHPVLFYISGPTAHIKCHTCPKFAFSHCPKNPPRNWTACWRLFSSQSPCKIVLEALKLKHEHWLSGRALKTKTFTDVNVQWRQKGHLILSWNLTTLETPRPVLKLWLRAEFFSWKELAMKYY